MTSSSSPARNAPRRSSSTPSTTFTKPAIRSSSPPKEIPEIEERPRPRLAWGLIADIQPPDFETRVAILKKKAAIERILLPDDVAYLIASRIKANIREIEGSLTRMIAFCSLSGRDMNTDLAQEVLADLWSEEEKVITCLLYTSPSPRDS